MTSSSRRRERASRSGIALKAVIAAYVLAAALLPLGHHDLACHLKSSTHCVTCVIGSSGELTADATTLLRQPLREAGRAAEVASVDAEAPVLLTASGRSPPDSL